MANQEKREIIAEAVGRLSGIDYPLLYDVLEREAIAIKAKVSHEQHEGRPKTFLFTSQDTPPYWSLGACGSGEFGKKGKALILVLSLEPE